MTRAAALAVAVILAIAGARAAAADEPVRLRVGWAQAPSQLTALFEAMTKPYPELFPHLGKTYLFEPLRFQGSTPQIQGLASGDLEIAALGSSGVALGVINAHLELRIVADVMQEGAPGYFSTYWAVRTDGPVQRIEDMKGHRAAINAFGATTDMILRQALRRHGVADSDYVVIEANFANMLPLMDNGKVDIVPVMPQFNHAFMASGHYRPLFKTTEIIGPSQVGMWVMRADVIAAHRPALVDFMEDIIRATRWILDPKNRDAALAIAAAVTKQSREELDYAFTDQDLYHSPDAVPNIAVVQKDIDEAVDFKLLPSRIEVAPRYVDLTLVADAKARIDGK
jgi:NitT/TauT family transport system substrate-binding protein